ncbi:hypothetical protein [Spiroplasma endosymbiont of Aspidapion aeneum]|uniref:hypothetical protein n=1 Tax=Spiroplasma endosymbiont of Aspidapion aeneum TaxID=3066276 RepID=UPI00313CDEBD
MANEILTKKYKSILDYNPPNISILKTIGPEIEFSITALLSNAAVETYFNMLSLEYYNYEFNQLLKINKLELKDKNTSVLDLTVLELVYNIVYQIVLRKWKYSSYIAYDVYILPIRIEKYIKALNYDLKKYAINKNKDVYRLFQSPSKPATIILNKYNYADEMNVVFEAYKTTDSEDLDNKLIHFNEIIKFIDYSWGLIEKNFGIEFATKIKNNIKIIQSASKAKLKDIEINYINKMMDQTINFTMVVFMLMVENMDAGYWDDIVHERKIRDKKIEVESAINSLNEEIRLMEEENIKKRNKINIDGHLELEKIKQPNINLNNANINNLN